MNLLDASEMVPQPYPLWVRAAHTHGDDNFETFVPIIGWVERPTSCGHSTYLYPVVATGHGANVFVPRDDCPWNITGRGPITSTN